MFQNIAEQHNLIPDRTLIIKYKIMVNLITCVWHFIPTSKYVVLHKLEENWVGSMCINIKLRNNNKNK